MIDHLELQTRDLDATARFYAELLEPLGYSKKVDGKAKGFGDDKGLADGSFALPGAAAVRPTDDGPLLTAILDVQSGSSPGARKPPLLAGVGRSAFGQYRHVADAAATLSKAHSPLGLTNRDQAAAGTRALPSVE